MGNPKNGNVNEKERKQRDSKGRFVAGNSAAAGRAEKWSQQEKDIKQAVKDIFKAGGEDAAAYIVKCLNDERLPPKLRLMCAEIVIDRVLGKPQQALEVETKGKQVLFLGGDKIAD